MDKEFVPYQEALELKELGFNKSCFKMSEHKKLCDEQSKPNGCQLHNLHCGYPDCTIDKSITPIPLPTFSQAFRFFREKYRLYSTIMYRVDIANENLYWDWLIIGQEVLYRHFKTPEEAELACLRKLIEIVKNEN